MASDFFRAILKTERKWKHALAISRENYSQLRLLYPAKPPTRHARRGCQEGFTKEVIWSSDLKGEQE